ncbi:MAG: hypothetical protein GY839_02175 [candidate division Zixibacteria bacterium]|nr:hypothetical protein [candidate division Zixibacteria bacterium]
MKWFEDNINAVRASLIAVFFMVPISSLPAFELAESFQYVSPRPDAKLVTKETNIILRPGEVLDISQDCLDSLVHVEGSISGIQTYRALISEDQKTIVIEPLTVFHPGETVTVHLNSRIKTIDKRLMGTGSYSFIISPKTTWLTADSQWRDVAYEDCPLSFSEPNIAGNNEIISNRDVTLPGDFPELIISELNNPDEGFIFMAKVRPNNPTYLMILDNSGFPFYYHRLPFAAADFKKQPNNLLSYYMYGNDYFSVIDSTYTMIDTFACGNGYITDLHDFQMIDNGHVLLMAYDRQVIDMSEVVPGGDPECNVLGLIIQELDSLKNVVFQWRSWDHFEITDATHANFQSNFIDYVHGNAIELDYDGNLLISCRNMDEVTKIDRQTGNIIWRLGGLNNDFRFFGDTTGFSSQHDIRRLPDGNITLYDNGIWHTPSYSRAVEYELDPIAMTCTWVWEFREDPDIDCSVSGNVQRLPNGNTMIGWGGPCEKTLVEVNPDGVKEFELSYEAVPGTWTYRAFRFPWYGIASTPYLLAETESDHIRLFLNKFGDTNIVKYYIYADTEPEPFTIIDSTTHSNINIYDLDFGQMYYFRVTAIDNQSNESPFSNEVSASIPGIQAYLPGDANMSNGFWPPLVVGSDVTHLVNYFRTLSVPCPLSGFYCSADINGDCSVFGSDVTRLVNYFRGSVDISYCPVYEPAWQTPDNVPQEVPPGWPNCEIEAPLNVVPEGRPDY